MKIQSHYRDMLGTLLGKMYLKAGLVTGYREDQMCEDIRLALQYFDQLSNEIADDVQAAFGEGWTARHIREDPKESALVARSKDFADFLMRGSTDI